MPKKWSRRKEDRPQEILDAAFRLFAARGFSATPLSEVAAEAGVTKGTLYLYFDSKESLFRAVIEHHLVPSLLEAEELVAGFQGPRRDLLRLLLRGWWAGLCHSGRGALLKLVVAEAGNFPALAQFYEQQMAERVRRLFEPVIAAGIQSGEFKALPARHVVRCMMSPLLFFQMWHSAFGAHEVEPLAPELFFDTYLELLVSGLEAAAPDQGATKPAGEHHD